MAQDLQKTIAVLQDTAIRNYTKRKEEAARQTNGRSGNDPAAAGAVRPPRKAGGITSVLKEQHGL